MNELRIWNIARTPADVAATQHKRLRGWEHGLVGYWPLSDGDALLPDLSPYAHHGTVQLFSASQQSSRVWSVPPADRAKGVTVSSALPSPVTEGVHTTTVPLVSTSGSAPTQPSPPIVRFAGLARLSGLKVRLWDSTQSSSACSRGAMWLRDRVVVSCGFDLTTEVSSIPDGGHFTVVLRACSRWGLSPLDGTPVPLQGANGNETLPERATLPPSTLSVQVTRLRIDRGVFDIRVYARGVLGGAVCLGECL